MTTPSADRLDQIVQAHTPARPPSRHRLLALLGPAFVAAVAYVDPGNVAANITAGARHGYSLVWVLALSNVMAVLIQYQSAKLGIVTGRSLPEILGSRLRRPARLAFWMQAELVAAATDLAEILGGAIALNLLTGMPLLAGGAVVGVVSMLILMVQERHSQRSFEAVIVALLVVITIGFMGGLVLSPPDWSATVAGLTPRLEDSDSLVVAASMLGATVMPHAIYLHSSLVRDHHDEQGLTPTAAVAPDTATSDALTSHAFTTGSEASSASSADALGRLIRATRVDVVWALALAGAVNIALLLLAASALSGKVGTDTIEGAHEAITASLGPAVGVVFTVGLLASGLASTSVGAFAGSEIMAGLLRLRVPLLARRAVTMIPALVIIASGAEPTWALVVSQVVLSFGIPLAIIPLIHYTASSEIMGPWRDRRLLRVATALLAGLVVALNMVLIVMTTAGLS